MRRFGALLNYNLVGRTYDGLPLTWRRRAPMTALRPLHCFSLHHSSLVSIPFRVSFFNMFKRRFLLSSSTLSLLLSAQAIVVSAECAGSQSLL